MSVADIIIKLKGGFNPPMKMAILNISKVEPDFKMKADIVQSMK